MPTDLHPEDILKSLEKRKLAPFYLFYGPNEFRLERVVDAIRNSYIPEGARDFNLEIGYGGEVDAGKIIHQAQTLPFMAPNRLIIVRKTEAYTTEQLEEFLDYLEDPSPSTCLIFIASKADFKKRFFKKIRSSGLSVLFAELKENQIVPWIMRTAKELGMKIDGPSCAYLQQTVGNNLRDLYAELIKLQLRHEDRKVTVDDVKELAVHSRVYSIFELMDAVSSRDIGESLSVLNRFLEEEDKTGAPLRIIGMLNRQTRILWRVKSILDKGGRAKEVSEKLNMPSFFIGNLLNQARRWSVDDFHRALSLLYQADGLLKTGSRPKPVLENLILTLCR
ncbi:MAG: DNA polymerase III subunit delta [Deltaproteobacteria bacterium]|nr:DNA polymerase III subunit delta [Deltaproteobacteria bacterium]